MTRKFHGKTENMGRPKKKPGDLKVVKTARLHPLTADRIKDLGEGNFTKGIEKMVYILWGNVVPE